MLIKQKANTGKISEEGTQVYPRLQYSLLLQALPNSMELRTECMSPVIPPCGLGGGNQMP
jgi:hypothetical protein